MIIDADDTLWYDSKYFQSLERLLLDLHSSARHPRSDVMKMLDSRTKNGVAGESGYARAVLETAIELGIDGRTESRLRKGIDEFLNHPVEILPYAQQSLDLMHQHRRVLVTKGEKSEQNRKLSRSGLVDFFDEVLVLQKKDTTQLGKTLRRIGIREETTVAIGNSIQHDIIPAVDNGIRAIWLNHPHNRQGRNGVLPDRAIQVRSWYPIYKALRKTAP